MLSGFWRPLEWGTFLPHSLFQGCAYSILNGVYPQKKGSFGFTRCRSRLEHNHSLIFSNATLSAGSQEMFWTFFLHPLIPSTFLDTQHKFSIPLCIIWNVLDEPQKSPQICLSIACNFTEASLLTPFLNIWLQRSTFLTNRSHIYILPWTFTCVGHLTPP